MNQRIIHVVCVLVGTLAGAWAQTDTAHRTPEATSLAMTRATINFLATDTKKFGRTKTPCEPCTTYGDLKKYVAKNRLLGADILIADAQKKAIQVPPSKLQAYLIERVAEGSRSYRKKLTSFPAYRQELAALVNGSPNTPDPSAVAVDNQPVVASTEIQSSNDSTDANDVPVYGQSAVTDSPKPLANSQPFMFTWLPLLLSFLSLAGVIFLWFRKSPSAKAPAVSVDARLVDFKTQIDKLKGVNSHLQKQIDSLKATAGKQPGNLVPQSQPTPPPMPAPAASPIVSPSYTQPVAQPMANTPRPPQPTEPTLFYGRTADLGDGFSVGGLSLKPDRDTIFEIRRLDATRAQFQVSDNPDLQRLALSDTYSYLRDTCSYATQPSAGSRIRTERHGTLSLQGNKWAIIEKAQISFL